MITIIHSNYFNYKGITVKKFILTLACLLLAAPAMAGTDGMTTLKESVVSAVKNHPQIKSMVHNRDAMSSNMSAALGRFFPSIDFSADYGYQEYSSSTTRAAGTDNDMNVAADSTLQLTQPLYDGMDRMSDYEGSKYRLNSAEYRLYDSVETVALDAIRSHIDVVRERKLVTLAGENITAHQEVLDSIVERVSAGAGSRADEMQARGRVARAETTLITYSGSLRVAEAEYARQTGKMPGPLSPAGYHPDYAEGTIEAMLDKAIAGNPKVKFYTSELDAIKQDKDMVQSSYLPTLDLQLSTRNTDELDGSETYIQDNRAMLAFNWNLFNGTSDYHRVQAADARVKEAQSSLQDAVDDLTRQVMNAWTEYQTAVKSVEKHQEALSYSQESRDMYLMQFNVGQRSLLDVLDSINEVFSNSVLLETAMSNREFSMYKFLALQGELVNKLEVASNNYDPEAE